ncbi:MAG: small, acid-soluble spore protein, alpha/beta type [Bacillota bacterium]|nr:small, acid-soluble spore protein, alpha/beta type [Bacillota bacterium]
MPKKGKLTPEEWKAAMTRYKYEVAAELGLKAKLNRVGWRHMTTEECGRIGGRMGGRLGGEMVKRLIARAEEAMIRGQKPTAPHPAPPDPAPSETQERSWPKQ